MVSGDSVNIAYGRPLLVPSFDLELAADGGFGTETLKVSSTAASFDSLDGNLGTLAF